jgi:hypothetical protein
MPGKDHIQAPQDDDDQINRTLRENLPDNINEVDLGAKDQKGVFTHLLAFYQLSYLSPLSCHPMSISIHYSITDCHKGLLSFIGDPLGKGLQKGLSPVGNLVGGTGDRMAGFTKQDQPKKGDAGGEYEKFGGKEQNSGNPLGL